MEIVFVRSWKPLALRGAVSVVLGLVALGWPGITLTALVLVFGAYSLIDGILAIAAGTRQRGRTHAWVFVLEGLVGVGIGLAALLWTGMAVFALVTLIGLWAIVTGVLEVALAVWLRREIPGEILLGSAGCASIVLGGLMLLSPTMAGFVIVMLLGSYALFFGTAMLILAWRLRRLSLPPIHRELHPHHGAV